MKTKSVITLMLVLVVFAPKANAQFLKKLKNKVSDKIEKTVSDKTEEKAKEKTEQALDSIFDKKKKNRKKKQDVKSKDKSFGAMADVLNQEDVITENAYTFPITATIQVTDFRAKNKEKTMQVMQSYGKNALLNIVENTPGHIIIDLKNNAAIILDIKNNVAQVMSLSWMEKMMGQNPTQKEENDKPNVVKTGNTKTLNGYTCHEYNITSKNTKINAWYAPNVTFNYQDYMRGFSKLFSGKKQNNPMALLNDGYGYVMEMTAFENNEKLTKMEVTKLSEISKTIDLSTYSVEKMF